MYLPGIVLMAVILILSSGLLPTMREVYFFAKGEISCSVRTTSGAALVVSFSSFFGDVCVPLISSFGSVVFSNYFWYVICKLILS